MRDPGLLDSALARPRQIFAYDKADLPRLAAAYGLGIAKNHPFVDGNKRTAFLASAVFLERNGRQLTADAGAAAVFTVALAAGTIDEAGYAAWLRDHSRPRRAAAKTRARPKS